MALLVVAAVAALVAGAAIQLDDEARTSRGLPGVPPPFVGVAVVGSGGPAAAIDAYGSVVEVRAPGPSGRARPAERVLREEEVARVQIGARSLPLWRADAVRQRYVAGTNALLTVARFGTRTAVVRRGIGGAAAIRADREWSERARPLGDEAPAWAGRLYLRSLLVLRALTDRRTGAVAAGIREGWAYVWPRDAAAAAMALASAGYRLEARRIVRFLLRLDLTAAARFGGDGTPVAGREAQGDAAGWVAAAARAAGLPAPQLRYAWRDRADYQEKESGDFLANSIAATAASAEIRVLFATDSVLSRAAGDPASGVDSAAAWAVRPFPQPTLFPEVRRSLHRLIDERGGGFGIVPSEDWPGEDPWTAPTAWAAWAFAALARHERDAGRLALARADRRTAISLMAALRRAATPLGLLPERVDAQTGMPASTTPLSWSHAFAILALRELWPTR